MFIEHLLGDQGWTTHAQLLLSPPSYRPFSPVPTNPFLSPDIVAFEEIIVLSLDLPLNSPGLAPFISDTRK